MSKPKRATVTKRTARPLPTEGDWRDILCQFSWLRCAQKHDRDIAEVAEKWERWSVLHSSVADDLERDERGATPKPSDMRRDRLVTALQRRVANMREVLKSHSFEHLERPPPPCNPAQLARELKKKLGVQMSATDVAAWVANRRRVVLNGVEVEVPCVVRGADLEPMFLRLGHTPENARRMALDADNEAASHILIGPPIGRHILALHRRLPRVQSLAVGPLRKRAAALQAAAENLHAWSVTRWAARQRNAGLGDGGRLPDVAMSELCVWISTHHVGVRDVARRLIDAGIRPVARRGAKSSREDWQVWEQQITSALGRHPQDSD